MGAGKGAGYRLIRATSFCTFLALLFCFASAQEQESPRVHRVWTSFLHPRYGFEVPIPPGKPGLVYSPFSSDQKLVVVKGIPSGTKVKCPYTMKIFLVP